MLQVSFVLRSHDGHREVMAVRMDAVPRIGDMVALDEIVRTVHAVTWGIREGVVTVLLLDH